ncbi:fucose synthetase [Pyrus ussuriensis x Pyrus communis]|uniref:Fucose synthetase n=1 Tax=Pyrus ussuriensis x Pyrus communis TaxID=2448454 RepID=A0A5N5G564_9ROSA|nr:fucose synthetase [Pyrus ussuriensis x Pyrus communis]
MPEPRTTIPPLSFSLSRYNSDLVDSAIVSKLQTLGFTNLILHTHSDLNLTREANVDSFLALATTNVDGIHANNTDAADFIAVNL